MEVLNDILGYSLKIYQDNNSFAFTLDSVLLANFVKINLSDKKILEIGSGTGAISLILSLRTSAKIDAIEIQDELVKLLNKSVIYNKLESQINVIHDDILKYYKNFNNYYDIIVSNPPYFKDSIENENINKTISRHEKSLNIDDLIKVSKKILKNNGKFVIIYDSNRFIEIIEKLIKSNLIPKRVMFIHTKVDRESNVFLLECVKNGKSGMKILPPFVIYNGDKYTEDYERIVRGGFLYEPEKL